MPTFENPNSGQLNRLPTTQEQSFLSGHKAHVHLRDGTWVESITPQHDLGNLVGHAGVDDH